MLPIFTFLLPFIDPLIKGVEKIFTKDKTGADKLDSVLQSLRPLIEKFLALGLVPVVPGTQPQNITDDALRGFIEARLIDLKARGELVEKIPAVRGNMYYVEGIVVPIKAL